jgi:hypothetical protein
VIQPTVTPSPWAHFTLPMILYTALGSAIFWGVHGRKKLKAYVLSDLFDNLDFKEDNRYRIVIEFVLFIGFGILIGCGVIGPTTTAQALTAGIAWTAMIAKRA